MKKTKTLDIINDTDISLDSTLIENLQHIALEVSPKNIEIMFVKDESMRKLNLRYMKKDYATDVLSFPLETIGLKQEPLGSIVINIDKAQEVSQNLKHTLNEEIALLFIHGILHLLGYDHTKDNGIQRAKEQILADKFNLPKSLTIRNKG